MNKVMQTKFGFTDGPIEEWGDCVCACVASLLDIPLADVPHFNVEARTEYGSHEAGYERVFRRFLRDRGYSWWILNWNLGAREWAPRFLAPGQLAMIGGPSPRSTTGSHAIVGRWTGSEWVTEHDPHPAGGGVLAVEDVNIFVPIEPTSGEG